MLERTSGLLADLTDCTAMVVGPSHDSVAIRSVQLVGRYHDTLHHDAGTWRFHHRAATFVTDDAPLPGAP